MPLLLQAAIEPLKSEELYQSTANKDLVHDAYAQSLQKVQTVGKLRCKLINWEGIEPQLQIPITFWKPQ